MNDSNYLAQGRPTIGKPGALSNKMKSQTNHYFLFEIFS